MGRAMLILTTLIFVVLGIIQVNTLKQREQATETNIEAYQKVQANNLGMTGFEFAVRKFKQNSSWRGPTSMNISGNEVTFEAEDYTTNPELRYGQLLVKVYTRANDRVDTTRAIVQRGGVLPPVYSALGFYSDSLQFDADGKSFEIDGQDENLDGTEGPASDLHGIKTTNSNAYNTIFNELEDAGPDQTENVTGEGGTPSMSVDENMKAGDLDELVAKYVDNADYWFSDGSYGSQTLGTDSDPKVTVIEENSDVTMSGGSGTGVLLIQEGSNLKLKGDFNFHGIVLNRGQLGQSSGNVKIIGALIFGSNSSSYQSLELDGNVTIQYSTESLSMIEEAVSKKMNYKFEVLSYYE